MRRETEGVEGNVHASRAWKGNDKPRCDYPRVVFYSFSRTFENRLAVDEPQTPRLGPESSLGMTAAWVC